MARVTVAALILMFSIGCSTTNQVNIDPKKVYLDSEFDLASANPIETMQQVFEITPSMQHYIDNRIGEDVDVITKVKRLKKDIFSPEYLNLSYRHDANFTAAQTFEKGYANCLSLTILTYVLATEADMRVKFFDIELQENWTVREEASLVNGHVNLQINPNDTAFSDNAYFYISRYTIDFMPPSSMKIKSKKPLSKEEILALFYNNKGADELMLGNTTQAYAYFKSATQLAPSMVPAWNNLASLYRQQGHYTEAEQAFLVATMLEPDNLSVKENLAVLYAATGRNRQAENLRAEVLSERKHNPYYYALLAEEALNDKRYDEAEQNFKIAIRKNKKEHVFHFGLAKVYLEKGDFEAAQEHLDNAQFYADLISDKKRYMNKSSLLSQLNH